MQTLYMSFTSLLLPIWRLNSELEGTDFFFFFLEPFGSPSGEKISGKTNSKIIITTQRKMFNQTK